MKQEWSSVLENGSERPLHQNTKLKIFKNSYLLRSEQNFFEIFWLRLSKEHIIKCEFSSFLYSHPTYKHIYVSCIEYSIAYITQFFALE